MAIKFVQNATGPSPDVAYSLYTSEAKANISSEQFTATFKQRIQPMGPFKNLHVVHRYLAKIAGGDQTQTVVCGNLSNPNGWVAVKAKPGPGQGYAIVEAETLNNTWAFVVWLLPEKADWRVQYFQSMPSAMVGKTATDLETMAMSEKQKNHNFNAYVLLVTAMQLAGRGPFLQLGIQQEIQENLQTLRTPHDLQGSPPFNWQLGNTAFKVLNVGPIGVGQKIYLSIDHEIEPWSDDKVADEKNHTLMAAFSVAYPEYKSIFAGLVVRAHERGSSRGFGTVSENNEKAGK